MFALNKHGKLQNKNPPCRGWVFIKMDGYMYVYLEQNFRFSLNSFEVLFEFFIYSEPPHALGFICGSFEEIA